MAHKFLLLYFAFATLHNADGPSMQNKTYTYLALGDSYTIGESVAEKDNFPNQTVQLLSHYGFSVSPPTILAKTGWTTEELQRAIDIRKNELTSYDFVSLLIGVNNQYRGGDPAVYGREFEDLLQQSIAFAHNEPSHVFVLSIPDWGVTPYAQTRSRKQIAAEIDSFNVINKDIALKWKVNYIDITQGSREALTDLSLIAADGLHPSAKEYGKWAVKLASAIQQQLR